VSEVQTSVASGKADCGIPALSALQVPKVQGKRGRGEASREERQMKLITASAILFCAVLSTSYAQEDFNTRVIIKVSEMLNTEPPKRILVEVVSQDKLQEIYKAEQFRACFGGNFRNLEPCADYVDSLEVFIHGTWRKEDDPTYLHIYLYEKAGINVLIHEYFHWWLHYRTTPVGIVNNDTLAESMMKAIIVSPTFVRWLGGVK